MTANEPWEAGPPLDDLFDQLRGLIFQPPPVIETASERFWQNMDVLCNVSDFVSLCDTYLML